MDIATADMLKEELMNRDPEFRELAREHAERTGRHLRHQVGPDLGEHGSHTR